LGQPDEVEHDIDVTLGSDADWTSGSGKQSDIVRKEGMKAAAEGGHGMGAADFHEGELAGD
jgi:hypothetical protein